MAEAQELPGVPTADQLLEAVQQFLVDDLRDVDPTLRFRGRVAANALDIVRRELRTDPDGENVHRNRRAALGYTTESQLAKHLRDLPLEAGTDPLIASLAAERVHLDLLVTNPGYFEDHELTDEDT